MIKIPSFLDYCQGVCMNGGLCSGPNTCTCPSAYPAALDKFCERSKSLYRIIRLSPKSQFNRAQINQINQNNAQCIKDK